MRLILYSRAGCHLCDRLEQAIRLRLAKQGLTLEKRDIDAEPDWKLLYGQRIPVLTCDGDVILEGNPSDATIAQAMRNIAV